MPSESSVLLEMLRELEQKLFYGALEIKFESGRPVLVKKTETIKPGYRSTRGENSESR